MLGGVAGHREDQSPGFLQHTKIAKRSKSLRAFSHPCQQSTERISVRAFAILPATQKPARHAPVVIAEIALCLGP
jgi:hypothetical protein